MAIEVYGIDLGTTNSCIAVMGDDGLPHVIQNGEGFYTTPSVVYYSDDGVVFVGDEAKAQMQGDISRTVAFIKREMGNSNYHRTIDGEQITPLKISAMILKKVVDDANRFREEEGLSPIHKAVITVPAYFGNTEKELTRQAGELAGLEVLQLIPEPTAAAISYGASKLNGKTFMIYDLGGGTFDISIMRADGEKFEELSNDGDHRLGGVDWDITLLNHVLQEQNVGVEYEEIQDSRDVGRMLIRAEQAKKNLSRNEQVRINFTYKGKPVLGTVSREDFEDLMIDRVDETITLMRKAIKNSTVALKATDIQEIVLVGGSSYMPMISKAVQEAFPNAKIRLDALQPDRAVAQGAAIYGYKLANGLLKKEDVTRLTSRSYGIKCFINNEEKVSNILQRGAKFGSECSENFETRDGGQTSATISIYENSSHDKHAELSRSVLLTSNALTWGAPVPAGTPIKVIMKISEDGTLRVEGECYGHKATYDVEVEGASASEREQARRDIERKTIC